MSGMSQEALAGDSPEEGRAAGIEQITAIFLSGGSNESDGQTSPYGATHTASATPWGSTRLPRMLMRAIRVRCPLRHLRGREHDIRREPRDGRVNHDECHAGVPGRHRPSLSQSDASERILSRTRKPENNKRSAPTVHTAQNQKRLGPHKPRKRDKPAPNACPDWPGHGLGVTLTSRRLRRLAKTTQSHPEDDTSEHVQCRDIQGHMFAAGWRKGVGELRRKGSCKEGTIANHDRSAIPPTNPLSQAPAPVARICLPKLL